MTFFYGGVVPIVQNGTQNSVIDYNHPFFVSPIDQSGIQIVSFQLTGIENYFVWFRFMRVSLVGRNKLGLVYGTCTKDKFFAELENKWERVNIVALS